MSLVLSGLDSVQSHTVVLHELYTSLVCGIPPALIATGCCIQISERCGWLLHLSGFCSIYWWARIHDSCQWKWRSPFFGTGTMTTSFHLSRIFTMFHACPTRQYSASESGCIISDVSTPISIDMSSTLGTLLRRVCLRTWVISDHSIQFSHLNRGRPGTFRYCDSAPETPRASVASHSKCWSQTI